MKARAMQQKEYLKELLIQQKITKKRVERERFIWKAMMWRCNAYGEKPVMSRSLKCDSKRRD